MKIPLLDIHAQNDPIREELTQEFTEILDTCQFIMGPKLTDFEERMAKYCESTHALGVSSGTDALLLALMALGVKPGNRVITTVFSFFATAGVIARLGAHPVFVDIDPTSFNIDPQHLLSVLEDMDEETLSQVKAIIPVHLYGQCADMENILPVASKHEIPVVEDAAQAIGAEYKMDGITMKAGSMGQIGCFSFFPSKNLGGIGDGGLVTCSDPKLFEKLKIMRVHGAEVTYQHEVIGGNFRMDPIQAAALSIKHRFLEQWHQERRANAKRYNELFKAYGIEEVQSPKESYGDAGLTTPHIYNQYKIRVPQRDELQAFLKSHDIASAIYYPIPFHQQPCFSYLEYAQGTFPHAEKAASEVLALPIYQGITEEMQDYVVRHIQKFYQSH